MKHTLLVLATCCIFGCFKLCKAISKDTLQVYVLFDKRLTWTEARDVCKEGNGTLLSVENQNKMADILYLDKSFWNNVIVKEDLWFGLHTDVGQECSLVQYKWEGLGALGSWTNWYTETFIEPNSCKTDLCIRISKTKWKTIKCTLKYKFVCQYDSGHCLIDHLPNIAISKTVNFTQSALNIHHGTLTVTGNLPRCLNLCKNSVMWDWKCWVVEVNDSKPTVCTLYYTHDKYFTDDSDNVKDEPGNSLHIRRCVKAMEFSGNATHPFTMENDQTELMSTATEFPGNDTHPFTMENDQTELISTATEFSGIATRPFTMENDQIDERDNVTCYKNVIQNMTLNELQAEIEKLQSSLRVHKKDTSLTKRKKISVYEARPSAVGMGVIASIIVVIFIALLLILDLPLMIRHYRILWPDKQSIFPSDITS